MSFSVLLYKCLIWYIFEVDMEKYLEKVKSAPLFSGISDEVLSNALKDAQIRAYRSGEQIDIGGYLIFILSGSVNVYSVDDRRRMLLRRIDSGGVSGVAGVFSGGSPSSVIFAKGACEIIFFGAETVNMMLEADRSFMRGFISFLSGRVNYLNKKITYLTAGSAERKLALFLDSFGADRLSLPVNLSAVSDMLDIGRASLYRALDRMAEDGCIDRDGCKITILDRKNMLEKY